MMLLWRNLKSWLWLELLAILLMKRQSKVGIDLWKSLGERDFILARVNARIKSCYDIVNLQLNEKFYEKFNIN
jgi:hypothetical protein